jgi:hypothetical protein
VVAVHIVVAVPPTGRGDPHSTDWSPRGSRGRCGVVSWGSHRRGVEPASTPGRNSIRAVVVLAEPDVSGWFELDSAERIVFAERIFSAEHV